MLEETSLSDVPPPQGDTPSGDGTIQDTRDSSPSTSDPHLDRAPSAPPVAKANEQEAPASGPDVTFRPRARRDRGKLVALGAMGALVAVGVGLLFVSPRRHLGLAEPAPPLALTSAELPSFTRERPATGTTNPGVEAP